MIKQAQLHKQLEVIYKIPSSKDSILIHILFKNKGQIFIKLTLQFSHSIIIITAKNHKTIKLETKTRKKNIIVIWKLCEG